MATELQRRFARLEGAAVLCRADRLPDEWRDKGWRYVSAVFEQRRLRLLALISDDQLADAISIYMHRLRAVASNEFRRATKPKKSPFHKLSAKANAAALEQRNKVIAMAADIDVALTPNPKEE